MDGSTRRDDDDLETPAWMCQVVASDFTGQVLAKARRRGESLREAQASTDPRTVVFINGIKGAAREARNRWLPGAVRAWWKTASRTEALNAYAAALEFSEVDEEAAAAADRMRGWFAVPSGEADPPN